MTRPNPKKPKENRAEWVKAGPRVKRVIKAGSQGYTWAEAGDGPSPAGTRTRPYLITKNNVVLLVLYRRVGRLTNPRSHFISSTKFSHSPHTLSPSSSNPSVAAASNHQNLTIKSSYQHESPLSNLIPLFYAFLCQDT